MRTLWPESRWQLARKDQPNTFSSFSLIVFEYTENQLRAVQTECGSCFGWSEDARVFCHSNRQNTVIEDFERTSILEELGCGPIALRTRAKLRQSPHIIGQDNGGGR